MKTHKYIALIATSISLVGCGGGGGTVPVASTPEVRETVPYSSTTSIAPNQITTASATMFTSSWNTFNAGSETASASSITTGSVAVGLDSSGVLDYLEITSGTPTSSVTFDKDNNDIFTVESDYIYVVNDAGDVVSYIFDPYAYDYMAFGFWAETQSATDVRIGIAQPFVAGYITPSSSIPTSGTATYSGVSYGTYFDGTDMFYAYSPSATATANFATGQIGLTTSNTSKRPLANLNWATDSSLNINGTLTYNSSTNKFLTSGLTTTGGLGGVAGGTGQATLYGPNAEEIGGVYIIHGSSGELFSGAFGAKQ